MSDEDLDLDDFGEFEEAEDQDKGERVDSVDQRIELDCFGRPLNGLPCVRSI